MVTGASGFIGHNMVRRLSELKAQTLVIDRVQPTKHFSNVEFEWADLRHLNQEYEADFLIHLAAVTNAGYAEKYPLETYETNVLGTVNLMNHVKISKRILFPSTALIYRASTEPISEDGELDQSSTYALSKTIGEAVLKFHSNRQQVDHTVVRFFNVFGPGQLPMYIIPQILRQIIEENKVVVRNGAVYRDMLFVDDCIDAVLRLAVTPEAANDVFNIGSGEMVSISDMAQQAISVSGRNDVEYTDLEQNINYSPTAIRADISKVTRTIDWEPRVSLYEGLKRMWESYEN
ncbi:MAG: NAD(P)-dependent oxidoreductase [Chloroflexi bacterium]|nr:NAD(P)-dependent oxidoreductase [Chloroflexota bacterium]